MTKTEEPYFAVSVKTLFYNNAWRLMKSLSERCSLFKLWLSDKSNSKWFHCKNRNGKIASLLALGASSLVWMCVLILGQLTSKRWTDLKSNLMQSIRTKRINFCSSIVHISNVNFTITCMCVCVFVSNEYWNNSLNIGF